MERLSGLDATFLHAETPNVHMHTLKVAVVEELPETGPNTFERFRDELRKRLHLLPPFRRRVVEVPFGFHHPVWIEDPNFDIDFHVRRAVVPEPGGRREMDDVVADIASHPLDERHPLWEIWRLEGLADGCVAYVAKIHHAVADGVAAAHLLANVMSSHREAVEPLPPAHPWTPEPIPSAGRLLVDALIDHLRKLVHLVPLIARTFAGFGRLIRHRLRGGSPAPMPFEGPRTSFNRSLTAARSFATTSVSLDGIKAAKSALGVTMNDVVLAIVGAGLRRYLEAHGEPQRRSLVAAVPVSVAGGDERGRLEGNRLSNLFTSLCSDVDDPVARTHAVHAKMTAAKAAHALLGGSVMEEWAEYVPPRPYGWMMRLYAYLKLSAHHRPAANVIVSNVRGPAEKLYVAGTRLRDLYSVGPIVEGIGVNVTAWSYADDLSFTVIAGREAVPDAHDITDCLEAATDQLVRAATRVEAGATDAGVSAAAGRS